jgi:hypothetical protein
MCLLQDVKKMPLLESGQQENGGTPSAQETREGTVQNIFVSVINW